MKIRWIVYLGSVFIGFATMPASSSIVTFQDGAYHRIASSWGFASIYIYNSFSDEPTTLELAPGGRIYGHIYVHDDSNVIISGGWLGDISHSYDLRADHDSNVIVSGGTITGNVSIYGNSNVMVSGGTIGRALLARNDSNVTISAGTMQSLSADRNSNVAISGGLIAGDLETTDNSHITVSGGQIGEDLLIHGTLIIDGEDYGIGGQSISAGTRLDSGDWAAVSDTLTCMLANGDLMTNNFTIYKGGSLVLVPEPTTLGLLILGSAALLRRPR